MESNQNFSNGRMKRMLALTAVQYRGGVEDTSPRIVWNTTAAALIPTNLSPVQINPTMMNDFPVDGRGYGVEIPERPQETRKFASKDDFWNHIKADKGPLIHHVIGCRMALAVQNLSVYDRSGIPVEDWKKALHLFNFNQGDGPMLNLHSFMSKKTMKNFVKTIANKIGPKAEWSGPTLTAATCNNTLWNTNDGTPHIFDLEPQDKEVVADAIRRRDWNYVIILAQKGVLTPKSVSLLYEWKCYYDEQRILLSQVPLRIEIRKYLNLP